MKISIAELTTDRKWRAATGLTQDKFERLLAHFKQTYAFVTGADMTDRGIFTPHEPVIKTEEQLLLFTLFSFKSNLTYDLLGLVVGFDGSNAKINQSLGISVLKETLVRSGHAPKREFETVAEFEAYFYDCDLLLLDGTEQRRQRPKQNDTQKDHYSGEKNSTP
jgi:hypothetical protein